ncbi:tyrosine-type recombinase/integrase [Pseudomonas sp. SbB1]|nr:MULTISPECIES: tyrosine-type recombinase/integrase [Pseudomonas]MBP0711541.1 tyrosine-type recombinase/integrase [Pseudomonas sp. T34]MCK2190995.1 site-specific integrase [Pseudomonas sp. MB04B]MDD2088399.1 site-specific integrase [Pseudomonas putida]MDD2098373.1 site-specific integrase [Pseudomonas putida]NOG91362.1 tyrosine-type recombinase/integrase [Pseudomonas sp. SbB1]
MLYDYDQNYSLADDGGSLKEHAYQLSLIIQYTYNNGISLLNMTESRLKGFLGWIRARKHKGRSPSINRTNIILSKTLDFLYYIGVQSGYPEYVSLQGAIKAERVVKSSIRRASGTTIQIYGWKHSIFLVSDGKSRTGVPIGMDTLEELRQQVDKISSDFIRRRTEVLFNLLEHIGGRRAEVGNVLVSSIIAALKTEDSNPFITIDSRKGVRGATREVPVARHVLEDALEFINTERRSLLSRISKRKKTTIEEDKLFISARTGRPIKVQHATATFHKLKTEAKINGKAHPHQMRHLFLSRLFDERVTAATRSRSSPLFSLDSILEKTVAEIRQLSGHATESGLNPYVKSAKEKVLSEILNSTEQEHPGNTEIAEAVRVLMDELAQVQPSDLEEFLTLKLQQIKEGKS